MNILLEKFPTAVEIDGEIYKIDTDFRNCINIILAFEDPQLLIQEKQMIMIELLYEQIPDDYTKAAEMAVKFLNMGEEGSEESGNHVSEPRVYSFSKDAKYIYSAFKQSHNIDLETIKYMHWWKFCYLFADLGECTFTRLIDLRSRKVKGKLTKEERQYCAQNQNIIDLPQIYTDDEIAVKNQFLDLLNKN